MPPKVYDHDMVLESNFEKFHAWLNNAFQWIIKIKLGITLMMWSVMVLGYYHQHHIKLKKTLYVKGLGILYLGMRVATPVPVVFVIPKI